MNMPLVLLNRRRRGSVAGFSPAVLFALAEPGVWYDPSDLTTLFTDSAGTTPVTTPGDRVGLMLDKSKGLVLGPELVVNGDFSGGSTGWTLGALWTVSDQQLVGSNVASGTYATSSSFTVVTGTFYRVTLTTTVTSGSFSVRFDNGGTETVLGTVSASGSHTFYVAAPDTSSVVGLRALASGFTGTVDNISVRELPGFHATQSTSGARPTYGIVPLGGRRNLLTFTEQFGTAPWANSIGGTGVTPTVTADAGNDPNGVASADRIQFSLGGGTTTSDISRRVQGFTTPATTHVFSVYLKATDGASTYNMHIVGPDGLTVNIVVTGAWQRFNVSATGTGANVSYAIGLRGGQSPANSNTADILAWGAQLELGSTASAYQRVGSVYDVTEAGVPSRSYINFDGIDDAMVTSTITPGIDKAQVFAGVRKLSSALSVLAELSVDADVNNGTLHAYSETNLYAFRSRGTGTSQASYTNASVAAPFSSVFTGIGDISGDIAELRLNGTQVAISASNQGTGNFLAYPLYIGARNQASRFFNGNLYSLIVRFGANLDAATIASTETWVGGKTQDFFAPIITGVPTIGVA